MKKFSAVYLMFFVFAQFSFWYTYFFPGLDIVSNPVHSYCYLVISFVLSITILILRFSGCKELEGKNPDFRRLYRCYWVLIGINFLITLIQFGAAELTTTYFYTNAEAGTLNPTLVHIYSFFLWFVTALLFYVPDLIVEYYLIRCIRPLGRGKPIGHRALRYVWYVSAAESLVHFVRRFISVVSTNDLYDELTKPRDFFNNVFDTYPPEAPALSISPWTIISWAISLAFAVCMIRVTVKLNRQQTSKKKVLKAAVSKAPSRDFWDLE